MNPKNTWILVALAAGLFAFIWFYERHIHEPMPPAPKVLPGFKAVDVTSIQIQPAGQLEIRADLTNGAWQLMKPLNYPAQTPAIEELLQALEDLTYQMRISAQALVGHPKAEEEFGTASPRCTILLQHGDEVHQLKFGNLTPPGDQMYVQVVGREGVDVVGVELLKLIPREPNAWRDPAFANLKGLALDRVSITNGTKVLDLQRDSADKLWHMDWPMQARADNAKVVDLLGQLAALRVSRFVTNDPRADLESFGLQPPQWTLTLGQGTNTAVSFQFGKSPTNDDSVIYAECSGQDGVVLVPRDQVDPWRADHEKFRDPHLAGLASGPPDLIEVSGSETENFSVLRLTNEVWSITSKATNQLGGLRADPDVMHEFIDNLGRLEVVPVNGQFAVSDAVTESSLPGYGLAPPVRKYLLSRITTNAAGGLTNVVMVELDFGSEKDGKVFARRPDEKSSVYAVNASDYEQLPARSLALLQRRIWFFTEDNVKSIAIRQDGVMRQLGHVGTNKWVVSKGSGMVDSFQAEAAAGELGNLAADTWVDCTTNQASYGFTDRSLQIYVEFFGSGAAAEPAVLRFGGWAPDKRRYGAVEAKGQMWVFELPPKTLDRVISYLGIHETNP